VTTLAMGGKMWLPKRIDTNANALRAKKVKSLNIAGWSVFAFGFATFISFIMLSVSRHYAWEYHEISKSPQLLNILVNGTPDGALLAFAIVGTIFSVLGLCIVVRAVDVKKNRPTRTILWRILGFVPLILGATAMFCGNVVIMLVTDDSATAIQNKSVASFESWMKLKGLDITHEQASEVIDDAWGHKNSNMYAIKVFEKPLMIDGKSHTVEIAKRGDNNLFFSMDTKKNAVSNNEATKRVNW